MKISYAGVSKVALPAIIFAMNAKPVMDAGAHKSRFPASRGQAGPLNEPSTQTQLAQTQWQRLQACDAPTVRRLQEKFQDDSPILCMNFEVFRHYERALEALSHPANMALVRQLALASANEGGLPHFMHALANCYGYALQVKLEPQTIEPGQLSGGFNVPRAKTCDQLHVQALEDGALDAGDQPGLCPPGRLKMRAYIDSAADEFRDWHWLVFDGEWVQKAPGLPSMPVPSDIDLDGPLPLQSFNVIYEDHEHDVFRVSRYQIAPYNTPCNFTLCSLEKA